MKKAVVLDNDDIKKIIAEHFGVDEKQVIKSQYTYTVVTEEEAK
jgi:hypothetical protein